jgi:hypothetical protein
MADHPLGLAAVFGVVTFLLALAVASAPRVPAAVEAGAGMFGFGLVVSLVTRRRRRI